jgi:DNA-binding PadR family transcriptional regulator
VLAAVADPRARRGVRHRLALILALAVCAVLAGARSFTAIAERAADTDEATRAGLGIGGAVPCESTIQRTLQRLDADAFDDLAARAGLPDRGLLTDSPAVYKVHMTQRAMQEATFLILTALAAGSQHGYGIITDVQEISCGRVRLRAGTLYTALERLRTDELITVDREEIVENRLRRYYRLTPKGSGLLAAEAARLQANAAAALSRLDLAGGMA